MLELVEGPTLADRIRHGPIPVDEALPIARQIAAALETAHDAGVIHRDLKPANIKVRSDGTVKVLDFGLAKALQPEASDASASLSPTMSLTAAATQMGMIIGTAAYMAPEQAKGKPVDKRADVWAFGAVLYEMVTGRRPFAGDDVSETLARVIDRDPDWTALPDTMPAVLSRVLRRCLEKDPKRRVRDIGDIGLAMEGAFEPPSSAADTAAVTPSRVQVWQRPIPLALAGLAIAVVSGLGVWTVPRPGPVEPDLTRFTIVPPDNAPFTSVGGTVDIALSANGTQLVYSGFTESEGRQLYLRRNDQLTISPVRGTEGAVAPFVSPDGEWVGFQTSATSLGKVSLLGGPPVTLAETSTVIRGVTWGSDDQIIFGTSDAGLFRIPAGGGEPQALTTSNAEEGELRHGWPSFIPGRNAVLFVTGAGRTGQIAVLDLATGEVTRLGLAGAGPHYVSSGHLVYAASDGSVLGVPFDPARLEVTGSPVPLIDGVAIDGAGATEFAVSATGRLAYVPGGGGDPRPPLVWVDREGATTPITTVPGGTTPRLSPDGERVLLEADGDLWIYDAASGRESRVTRDGASARGAWDPSGTRVAYSSGTGEGQQVWVAPTDASGEPRQRTDLGDGQVHVDSWSRDGGSLMVHQHRGGAINLLTVPMDDANAAPDTFLEREFSTEGAVFSPDGRYVAYQSQESGQREIYVRPYPGPGGQQTVSVGGGQQPVWAATGELFYRDPDGRRMMAVSMTTDPMLIVGTPRELFQGSYVNLVPGGGSPRP